MGTTQGLATYSGKISFAHGHWNTSRGVINVSLDVGGNLIATLWDGRCFIFRCTTMVEKLAEVVPELKEK